MADGFAELLPCVDIGQHLVDAGLHDAHRASGEHRALVVEARHEDCSAHAFLPQYVFRRYWAVFEHQFAGVGAAHTQLIELGGAREARVVTLYDECGDTPGARRVCFGVDHIHIGVGAVGNPHLAAVEDVLVALAAGVELHAHYIGARIGLGHGQGTHLFAAAQRRQVLLFLCLGAVAIELIQAEIGHGAVGQAHGS